jgi:pimeloyl-ACP methyl ester carboxylesterase
MTPVSVATLAPVTTLMILVAQKGLAALKASRTDKNPLLSVRPLVMLLATSAIVLSSAAAFAQDRRVVFVHGIKSDGESWRAAADRLQAALAMRAETPSLSAGALYEMQANELQAYAGDVGPDVVAVAHSNGGVVARQWSRLHPVSALVTVGTPHRGAPVVANLGRYAKLNLNLLSSISDVFSLFAMDCCNWQSLLSSYSLWWSLAYDLASNSLWQIGTSLGLTVAQPVVPEMLPGSAFLSGLNSPDNLWRESAEVAARVAIVSEAHNFYWGGALRAAFPDHGDSVAYWRDVAKLGMDYAAAFLMATADYGDSLAFDIANGLLFCSHILAVMDEFWCQTVSVTGLGLCWSNDTFVPEWSQMYPGGVSISTGFDGPAHTQETRMSDALLQEILTNYTSIPPRGNELPPSSPPAPPAPPAIEALFHSDIEFAGQTMAASGDLSFVGSEWNDKISSVHVPAGATVVLYERVDYGGDSLTLSGDVADLSRVPGPSPSGNWNDAVSSIRVF